MDHDAITTITHSLLIILETLILWRLRTRNRY